MSRQASSFMAAALAATFAVGSVVPLNAAPIVAPVDSSNSSGVIKVQQSRAVQEFFGPGTHEWRRGNREWRRADRHLRREFRRDRREFRRAVRQSRRDYRRGLYRHGDWWYYNGYRGYRHRRPGWRFHDGWWFPPAAFLAGAVIVGALANDYDNDYYEGGNWNAHVRWCYNRYRSYREWDNTYQPYHGPRRQCYSPYS